MAGEIHFYGIGADYGAFSNFAPYPIRLDGKTWPTSAHYFQAQKLADPKARELVRVARTPAEAAKHHGTAGGLRGRAVKRSLAVLCSVVSAVFWPALSLACSGPNAGEVIAGNQRASFLMFLAGAVAAIHLGVRFRTHPKKGAWLGVLALLSLLHPMWWLSAMSGDCGHLLLYASIAVGLVQLAIVVAGHVRLRRGQEGG